MKLELDLPEILVRKIKALTVMNGGSENLTDQLVSMFEKTVDEAIMSFIDTPRERISKIQGPEGGAVQRQDQQELSFADGLGEPQPADEEEDREEEVPPPVEDMYDLVPPGGASDEFLENDMVVDDPEHEAKAEAEVVQEQSTVGPAEESFSRALGIDTPEDYVDHRILKRKKKLEIRGKVTPAAGDIR